MLINLVILEIIIYMFLQSTPFKVLVSRYRLIIFSGLVVGLGLILFFLILSFVRVMPLEYRADAQALIISQSRYGVDPYTAAKSAERVGENLIQVMKTDDFYQKKDVNNVFDNAKKIIDKTPAKISAIPKISVKGGNVFE